MQAQNDNYYQGKFFACRIGSDDTHHPFGFAQGWLGNGLNDEQNDKNCMLQAGVKLNSYENIIAERRHTFTKK